MSIINLITFGEDAPIVLNSPTQASSGRYSVALSLEENDGSLSLKLTLPNRTYGICYNNYTSYQTLFTQVTFTVNEDLTINPTGGGTPFSAFKGTTYNFYVTSGKSGSYYRTRIHICDHDNPTTTLVDLKTVNASSTSDIAFYGTYSFPITIT